MNVLVTGSTGLVGSAFVDRLEQGGHEVGRLVRSRPRNTNEAQWDPAANQLDASHMEGVEAVVHLAGESIANGRWNAAKKQRIRASRVQGTRLLVQKLLQLEQPPSTLVCASAIGFYGDRGSEELTEDSPPGSGYLADVCRDWEAESQPAIDAGIRVVKLRIGVVLAKNGGALATMLPPFRMGLGGKLGNGSQYFSWITLDDLVGSLLYALTHEDLQGAVNAVAPTPVTNQEFTRTLGKVIGRPTIIPMPGFAARLAFGEMADALLLASTRVLPQRLNEHGYRFQHPDLEPALQSILGA